MIEDELLNGDGEADEVSEAEIDDNAAAIEADARAQRWVPKDEFKGNPRDWVSAEEYLRRSDPKHLRKQLDMTRKEVRDLRQARDQDAKAFAERLDRFEAMSKAQRTKLYGDIETARRQAVEAGDTAEYDRLNQVEANLYDQERAAGKTTAKPAEREQGDANEVVEAWIEENPWWDTEPKMQHAAMTINNRIAKQYPDLSPEEQLAKTLEQVEKRFPEYFEKKPGKMTASRKTNGHAAVEGGGRMVGSTRGKGFTDIPAEERAIIKRHIEEGLYSEPGEKMDATKAQARAAKSYWGT